MKEMGLKAYRFSISWSRVFPEGSGTVNEEGLRFYHDLIDELTHAEIEPIVTLYHFDLPLALHNKGGWSNKEDAPDKSANQYLMFIKHRQRAIALAN